LELVERADHVVERRARRRSEGRRDAEVVFEANAQSEPRGVVEIAQHVVVVAHLSRPREVVRYAVRPHRHRARAPRERDGAVGTLGVDVVIEELERQGSGWPAHAASTSVHSTPDTRVCPPSSSGNGAARAAAVNSRSSPCANASERKRSDAKRSCAEGCQPRCAKSTRVSKSIPSPSSPRRAKNAAGPISR